MLFRAAQLEDVQEIRPLVPEEWHFDIAFFLLFHYNKPYFRAVCVEEKGRVIGFGSVIQNASVAWVGNILVDDMYRNQGIGTSITRFLIDESKAHGAESFVLIATELGEPVYKKLGFTVESYYVFYERNEEKIQTVSSEIRKISVDDYLRVSQLEYSLLGEKRDVFLRPFLHDTYCLELKGCIEGLYFHSLGNGLIIAQSSIAGLGLLTLKIAGGAANLVIPEQNKSANLFVLNQGYIEIKRLPRMIMGAPVLWHPDCVYNRGAGYCG